MRRLAPWLVVAGLALAYPIVTLAGGSPDFPTRDGCIRPATSNGEIEAVFGYFESELDAASIRDRALEVGFVGTELDWNGCGLVRVSVGGIPTLEVGRAFAEQAREADLPVTLEQAE